MASNTAATQNLKSPTFPRLSRPNAPFATVIVGPEKISFTVHLDLLVYHSPFFRAALTGNFKEATTKTVLLPTEKSETFEFCVHWLYNNRLPDPNNDDTLLIEKWGTSNQEGGYTKTGNLIELYVFCGKYQIDKLRVKCLEKLLIHVEQPGTWLPSCEMVQHAFENLDSRDILCRWMVHAQCQWVIGVILTLGLGLRSF
ncbi:BTB domain containing protein [Pyrenophora tritici-repentis]|nr:BTB domain containing protein [Pyrenophora tritici-repentis]